MSTIELKFATYELDVDGVIFDCRPLSYRIDPATFEPTIALHILTTWGSIILHPVIRLEARGSYHMDDPVIFSSISDFVSIYPELVDDVRSRNLTPSRYWLTGA